MKRFTVGLSPDFETPARGALVKPDAFDESGMGPGATFERITDLVAEYRPDQLVGYDVLLSLSPRVSASSLAGVDRLCAVGRCGVGYDNVDLEACTAADVAVFITPGAVARPMAESIVLFVLALSHRLVAKDRLTRTGNWAASQMPLGVEPRDRTIGTIGLGRIAREAVSLLAAFGPERILAHDPFCDKEAAEQAGVELTSLEGLLRESDYVLVNCPLLPETRGLIGADALSLMKPSAFLINTARGSIVDEDALAGALESGKLAGAALDVFATEPLVDLDNRLLQLDNVIVTSHSIGWTEELFRDMVREACAGAAAIAHGQAPPNVVNREVLNRPGFQRKLANLTRT
jgi:phosphoglycerate dehydrogenase-like enzyme